MCRFTLDSKVKLNEKMVELRDDDPVEEKKALEAQELGVGAAMATATRLERPDV